MGAFFVRPFQSRYGDELRPNVAIDTKLKQPVFPIANTPTQAGGSGVRASAPFADATQQARQPRRSRANARETGRLPASMGQRTNARSASPAHSVAQSIGTQIMP